MDHDARSAPHDAGVDGMTEDVKAGMFSSRRPLALGFWALLALGLGLFGWGAFGEISGAVIAVGQVGVESGDQVVEHADGGIVTEIRVRNGDRVDAGDVLVRLDDALLRSEYAIFDLITTQAKRNLSSRSGIGGVLSAT